MDVYHRQFVQEVVFAIIRDSFPESQNALRGLWAQLEADGSASTVSAFAPADLAAASGYDEHSYARLALGTTIAMADFIRAENGSLTPEQLEGGIRGFLKGVGVRGQVVGKITDAVLPHVLASQNALVESLSLASCVSDQPLGFLFEADRLRSSTDPVPIHARADTAELLTKHDLVVDEVARCCVSRTRDYPFHSLAGRKGLSLWLVLHFYGRSFSEQDLVNRLASHSRYDRTREHASIARSLMLTLIGREVIPDARNGTYSVLAEGWSWAWVRSSAQSSNSILFTGLRE